MARVHLCSTLGGVLAGFLGLGIGLAQASPSLSACLAECKRAGLSATNRASCRLDCETEAASDPEQVRAQMARQAPGRPASPGPAARPETRAAKVPGCKAGCDADRSLSVDDRASCKLDCEQEALPVPGGVSPAAASPAAVSPAAASPAAASPVTPSPTPSVAPQPGFLARCHATCRPGPSQRQVADFETCKLDCETMASVLGLARGLVPDAFLAPSPSPATPGPIAARVAPPAPAPVLTTPASPPASGCEPALARCNAGCSKQEAACSRSCARGRGSETDRETCKLTCGTDREVCQGDCLSARATCENNQVRR